MLPFSQTPHNWLLLAIPAHSIWDRVRFRPAPLENRRCVGTRFTTRLTWSPDRRAPTVHRLFWRSQKWLSAVVGVVKGIYLTQPNLPSGNP